MARKKWIANTNITPELIKIREKRKWQIALRRYVLEGLPCVTYAPYFGLDSKTLREWFEIQFEEDMNWSSFATSWQFDHIIPVIYFDFSSESELRLCWNFTNLRVEPVKYNKNRGQRVDVLAAKAYFKVLYDKTGYLPCQRLLEKIDKLELSELANSEKQFSFLVQHRPYLEIIEGYSDFEFGLLNSGKSIEEVSREMAQLKKLFRT